MGEETTCCSELKAHVTQHCPLHPDLADCPDAIIILSKSGEYRFPIRDGGSSFIKASFCPWCGTRLYPATNPLSSARWRAGADVLAQIGVVLFHANLAVEVEIPADLAKLAVAAWDEEEAPDGIADNETAAEAAERHRAGALSLIGVGLSERGRASASGFAISLDPWLIGQALDAADDAGLIVGPPQG